MKKQNMKADTILSHKINYNTYQYSTVVVEKLVDFFRPNNDLWNKGSVFTLHFTASYFFSEGLTV